MRRLFEARLSRELDGASPADADAKNDTGEELGHAVVAMTTHTARVSALFGAENPVVGNCVRVRVRVRALTLAFDAAENGADLCARCADLRSARHVVARAGSVGAGRAPGDDRVYQGNAVRARRDNVGGGRCATVFVASS